MAKKAVKTDSLNGEWGIKGGRKRRKIKVPSNWFLEGFDVEELTYKKEFSLPETKGKHKRLVFGGVDYYAEVWLNGVKLGEHEGYFTPFSFDVDGVLKEKNRLEVKVGAPKENPYFKSQVKGILQQWDCRPGGKKGQDKGSGGIWKSVSVESFGDYRIENVKVTPDYDERTVTIEPVITSYVDAGVTTISVKAAGREWNEKAKVKKGTNRLSFRKKVDVRDWEPWDRGEPNLYDVSIGVLTEGDVQDSWEGRFGMRKVEWKGGSLWLNNKRYFLRGTNYCSSQWLSEMDRGKYAKDMALLKGMNANAIRVHAHVENDAFYDVCDEQGILVWQDFPLQWEYQSSPSMIRRSTKMIREMVDGLYNHPSIFLWCCHNEPFLNRFTLDPFLKRAAEKEDRSRIVKKFSGHGEHHFGGWYKDPFINRGSYGSFSRIAKTRQLITEFGAQGIPNLSTMKKMFGKDLWPPDVEEWEKHNYQPKGKKFLFYNIGGVGLGERLEESIEKSQSYQAELNKSAIEAMRRCKYGRMAGIFQYMLVDSWPSITWSVLDYYRQPKKAYEAVKDAYSPVLVSIEDGGEPKVYVVNDLNERVKGRMKWSLKKEGRMVEQGEKNVKIGPDAVAVVKSWSLGKGAYTINARLKNGDKEYRNSASFKV